MIRLLAMLHARYAAPHSMGRVRVGGGVCHTRQKSESGASAEPLARVAQETSVWAGALGSKGVGGCGASLLNQPKILPEGTAWFLFLRDKIPQFGVPTGVDPPCLGPSSQNPTFLPENSKTGDEQARSAWPPRVGPPEDISGIWGGAEDTAAIREDITRNLPKGAWCLNYIAQLGPNKNPAFGGPEGPGFSQFRPRILAT